MSFVPVLLRRVTDSDLDEYIALESTRTGLKTYHSLTDKNGALEQIRKSVNYFIVVNNEIVGSVSYCAHSASQAEIDGVLVKPSAEGKGYAKAAIHELLKELADYSEVYLMTHPENPRSIFLYQSQGFEFVERVKNYFGDGEPRIKLVLKRS